jgi:hypothetical protein
LEEKDTEEEDTEEVIVKNQLKKGKSMYLYKKKMRMRQHLP